MSLYRRLKRGLDVACVLGTAPLTVPLLAAGAVLVKATSDGPALFAHRRIGKDGRPFSTLKLRTMTQGADKQGPAVTAAGDARITPVGRILRKTKLDELPQLINVLRGDMSIVGPRPEAPAYVDEQDPRWQAVLQVRPGITDLSSLTFRHEEDILARATDREWAYREVVLPKKLELAQRGVESQSLLFDLGIVAKTALSVLGKIPAEQQSVLDECLAQLSTKETPT